MRLLVSHKVGLALCLLLPVTAAIKPFDGQRWWTHMSYLADDDMQGRETGSPGYFDAARYVAAEFERAGLDRAGTQGYYQLVKFRSRKMIDDGTSVAIERDGTREVLNIGDDTVVNPRVDTPPSVDAQMVFAGYGLTIPEANYDDFAGLDVKGKVVVYLLGAPPKVPGALASHYQSAGERAASLRKLGAIGTVNLPNPAHMDLPWSRIASARVIPAMVLADPEFDDMHGIVLSLTVNPASADKLLAGSGHDFKEIVAAAHSGQPLPHFAIPGTLHVKTQVETKEVQSPNVVAKFEGSDPKLKDEFVVFSAHLDHLGVGAPINGDSIYNGAMDNASGVAAMLDVAASLREKNARPKRSLLFVAVCGEEKGLLGSRYFAAHPTVDAKQIVADINTDMFLPLFPLKILTVYGLDESTLGDDIRAAAKSLGIRIQPDPEPLRNVFIRSDQYSFIRRGIPALTMKVGYEPGSPEEKIAKTWLAERYHAPSDDVKQPMDKTAAGKFDHLVAALLMRVADARQRPEWRQDSFFRRFKP
jgi:Zn-dependent M28 family amino/carboxypeptidase